MTMTMPEFRTALDALRWSAGDVASFLACPRQTVAQWQIGRVRVPEDVSAWIAACRDAVTAIPVPVRRERKADRPTAVISPSHHVNDALPYILKQPRRDYRGEKL